MSVCWWEHLTNEKQTNNYHFDNINTISSAVIIHLKRVHTNTHTYIFSNEE